MDESRLVLVNMNVPDEKWTLDLAGAAFEEIGVQEPHLQVRLSGGIDYLLIEQHEEGRAD